MKQDGSVRNGHARTRRVRVVVRRTPTNTDYVLAVTGLLMLLVGLVLAPWGGRFQRSARTKRMASALTGGGIIALLLVWALFAYQLSFS